ncbi:MAG: hypothetical protein JNJ55_11805 [Betaproteobacteria bacterium]|nr:hypothetical protein [Betaproteobacteria bacterium]
MKTSKDNLLMSTLVAAMVTLTATGAIESLMTPQDFAAAAAPAGPQAAVRPTTTDVPSVVVVAPRVTRVG